MNKAIDLHKLIESGEGKNLEFKSNFNNDLIETLVAFANTDGGMVIIGINQKNKITGVTINPESIQNWINEVKQKTSPILIPDVEIVECENKVAVVFSVPEYPIKPVATKGKYFKRVVNSNHSMSIDEIANEHLKTINSSWDFYPDPNHGLEHISFDKVNSFIHKIEQNSQTKIQLSSLDFLSKLEIIRNNQITFGGYLLFVKDHCLISDIQVGRFKSDTMIIDSLALNTDLFNEVEEIIKFIKKNLMVEFIITGKPQRTERFDYPLDAIREIVINMIVHRDYRDSSHSLIKIFDDKIEFFNPGKLYGNLTVANLLSGNYTSQTRNKLIAKSFKEIGLVERYGSGVQRIINICSEYGIKQPLFEETSNGFKVTLFKEKKNVGDNVGDNVVDNVVDRRLEKIIEIISRNNKISALQIANALNISSRTAQRDIEKLKQQNRLKRVGSEKSGYWKIIKT